MALGIGGRHVAGALVDTGSAALSHYRHRETGRDGSSEELLRAWSDLILELASEADTIDGVGIAIPGPFDYREGVAHFEGNDKFESLYGINVGEEIRRRTGGRYGVRFLNDATAFAVGCVASGAAPKQGPVVALTLGTGLGAAFLEDGIPVVEERAGQVPPDGCLWHLSYGDGIADGYVSTRWLLSEAAARTGHRPANVAEQAALARADPAHAGVFEQYGRNLAAIVGPWARGFSAAALMLGGRITGAFDLFSPALTRGLLEAGVSVPILIHENTEDAAIMGAAQTFEPAFWDLAEARLPPR